MDGNIERQVEEILREKGITAGTSDANEIIARMLRKFADNVPKYLDQCLKEAFVEELKRLGRLAPCRFRGTDKCRGNNCLDCLSYSPMRWWHWAKVFAPVVFFTGLHIAGVTHLALSVSPWYFFMFLTLPVTMGIYYIWKRRKKNGNPGKVS